MLIHVYYTLKGQHAHCRVFVGPHANALAHAGNLVLRSSELIMLARGQFKAEYFEEDPGGEQ